MEEKNMILHIFMYNVVSDFSAVTPASEGRVNYKSMPRGSLLGTFEPVGERVNEIHTSWEKLEGQVCQAHAQLQRKRSYNKAREKV